MVAPPFELFEGTDGRYYTDWQIRHRLRSGEWTFCMRQRTPHRCLVETADGALLLLAPTTPAHLPAGFEIRVSEHRVRVVDRRRMPPASPNRCGRSRR